MLKNFSNLEVHSEQIDKNTEKRHFRHEIRKTFWSLNPEANEFIEETNFKSDWRWICNDVAGGRPPTLSFQQEAAVVRWKLPGVHEADFEDDRHNFR